MNSNFKFSPLLVLFAATFFFASACTHGAEDRKWDAEAKNILNRSKDFLVSKNICADANDCVKQQLVFSNSESWGVFVETYGVTDAPILKELTSIVSDCFFRKSGQMTIKLKINSMTKKESLDLPVWKSGPSVTLTFKGDQNVIR